MMRSRTVRSAKSLLPGRPLVLAIALVAAAVTLFVLAGRQPGVPQTLHVIDRLDGNRLTTQAGDSEDSFLKVTDTTGHIQLLRLDGAPQPGAPVQYWENSLTHEVSTRSFTSDAATGLWLLGVALGLMALWPGLIFRRRFRARSRIVERLQHGEALPSWW